MSVESTLDQEDWEEVEEEWWRSHYKNVPWSYRRQFLWSLDGFKYADHPSPPHYQNTLHNACGKAEVVEDAVAVEESLELHEELVGVKGAEAAMRRYESDVGITSLVPRTSHAPRYRILPLYTDELTEEDISAVQSRWDDQVRGLFGEAFRRSHLDTSYDWDFDQKVWNMDDVLDTPSRTSTSPDVVDLTDSELSAESEPPPSTPNADRKSYAQVVFVDRAGNAYSDKTVVAPSPAKPLNASALSFVPATGPSSEVPSRESSESPYTSPTYEFHFPSLSANPPSARTSTRSLPLNLEKDEQGFYIEVPSPSVLSNDSTRTATPKRPSASLLPAFLAEASNARNRHISKTRSIVDGLRSSTTSTSSDPPRRPKKAELPSPRSSVEDPELEEREVDVFVDPISNIDGWITSIENEALASASPLYNDGWIEGTTKGRRAGKAKSHKRSESSISSIAPTTTSSSTSSAATSFSSPSSTTAFSLNASPANQFPPSQPFYSFAAPYSTTASPYGNSTFSTQAQAQAAYFQMQYQMQLQAQAQWQMQMQANARMQAGIAQGYPMFPPLPLVPHSSPATPTAVMHSRAKSVPYTEPKRITVPITGVAGIRHV
ncbi:hypothetical protein EUX98_g8817 [Antrodiella citrinella]|uniref:Uncharacterized protein n=1 Tax=Antrodiella citrinella TaxID=2447956 RepID=A0A4V3XFX7_9APHY|nr:hypothetical protein EUX98_g8817 [Antrodiella citrinella]